MPLSSGNVSPRLAGVCVIAVVAIEQETSIRVGSPRGTWGPSCHVDVTTVRCSDAFRRRTDADDLEHFRVDDDFAPANSLHVAILDRRLRDTEI